MSDSAETDQSDEVEVMVDEYEDWMDEEEMVSIKKAP